MKYLLDTNALLFYALNDPALTAKARALIIDPANEIWMSPASYWEIAIKVSIGKLKLNCRYEDFTDVCVNQYRFRILPIEPNHTAKLASLPFPPNHKDPFDRLLVAQAIEEQMGLISNDALLDAYPIKRYWN